MLKVKKLDDAAVIPEYQTDGAAAFDLVSITTGVVPRGSSLKIHTGLAMEIPEGYAGIITVRSGLGFKADIATHNGLIDSDYRGEIAIKVRNFGCKDLAIYAGDRIAQMRIVEAPRMEIKEVKKLGNTKRGEGGYGSTGK